MKQSTDSTGWRARSFARSRRMGCSTGRRHGVERPRLLAKPNPVTRRQGGFAQDHARLRMTGAAAGGFNRRSVAYKPCQPVVDVAMKIDLDLATVIFVEDHNEPLALVSRHRFAARRTSYRASSAMRCWRSKAMCEMA
ncbi:MAG: hypothetical protein ABI283_05120 [Rhodanobacter sp.]